MTDDNTPTQSPDAGTAATATKSDDALVDALSEYTVPLESTDPTAPLDDIAQFHDHLADARVVGLGEATHGTREFFQLKHRFVQYLVTELDCRAFALEANFSETLALDDYVVHGEGDPREALDAIYFWTWNVESVLALVEWLREFNAARPLDDRVRFYGVDAQYSQGAVDALREFFEDVDPEFLERIAESLDAADDDAVHPMADEDLDARVRAGEDAAANVQDAIDANHDAYVARTSSERTALARQHARVLAQATEFKGLFAGEGEADAETMQRRQRHRDRTMADNLDWVLDRAPTDRVALWAHDAHLNRVHQQFRGLDLAAPSVGSHLADRYGTDYYAIGFAFARGAFQAKTEDDDGYSLREQTLDAPLPGTIEATLAGLEESLAVLDLRAATTDHGPLRWLDAPIEHFSTGATYDDSDPTDYLTEYVYTDAFDALCYVEETTRARPLADE